MFQGGGLICFEEMGSYWGLICFEEMGSQC